MKAAAVVRRVNPTVLVWPKGSFDWNQTANSETLEMLVRIYGGGGWGEGLEDVLC